MLLTISSGPSAHGPATELGDALRRSPARCQGFDLGFGTAYVLFPEASEQRCTAALLLDVDAAGPPRKGVDGAPSFPAANAGDRPYVASARLSVAIAHVFASALSGAPADRPALGDAKLPLEVTIPVLPCRGGEAVLRALFEPLGYALTVAALPLDAELVGRVRPTATTATTATSEERGLFTVVLRAAIRVRDLLAHLVALLPVLDDDKHEALGDDEIDALLRHGDGWLPDHPARELIAERYARRRTSPLRRAFERLTLDDDGVDPDLAEQAQVMAEERLERAIGLGDARLAAVASALKAEGAKTVLDLGTGEAQLLDALADDPAFERVVGVATTQHAFDAATARLKIEEPRPGAQPARVEVVHGALTYRDKRLAGFDAAAALEVIEHLDPARLGAFTRVLFAHTRPRVVILTTPNAEYDARFEGLARTPRGALRRADHRFEWTRAELRAWARDAADLHGYAVRFQPIGPVDPELGPPTQMAVFVLGSEER